MARLRVTVEEPCVHGIHDRHPVDDVTEWSTARTWCAGGSRRVLDPGSFVLIEKAGAVPHWPEQTLDDLADTITLEGVYQVFDALAGGEQ